MKIDLTGSNRTENLIQPVTYFSSWAGRSAVDRLLCKQEVSGSNPDRSIPYIQKFVNSIKIPLSYLRLESPAASTSVFLRTDP